MQCSRCSKETPEGSVVCPFCATPLDQADAITSSPTELGGAATPDEVPLSAKPPGAAPDEAVTSADPVAATPDEAPTSAQRSPAPPPLSLSDSGQHGRFLPGTTVAERYRIVGLLGRGGMGEVYRADDLRLGQQVALKFLPRKLVADAGHVERLLDEVRMARKVSHPNVCRVWDIGEADGHQYVSMEYVDGEDLASLLRRIGRLPKDKAVEISRQLCAALAAAHDEGVLHRDLKPANIMLDGRGRVKLTDFGLAAVAEVRAGTPIYMAPEQLAGEEVSVRSDLYALGLVLHELFTGNRVFDADDIEELKRQHERSLTTSLTSTSDLDPAIDRVIGRCLQPDPRQRPQSALAVAAALPGADPLAAALAAGETPSPELVAESGGEGSLPVTIALPLLLVTLICAVAAAALQSRTAIIGTVPFDMTPAMLEARAHEVLTDLGYATDYADRGAGFSRNSAYTNWLQKNDASPEQWEALRGGRPMSVYYWWRSSPETLIPEFFGVAALTTVSATNPPNTRPGMVSLRLDTVGRLVRLEAVPDRVADQQDVEKEADWTLLFAAAGLDVNDFTEVAPRFSPPHFAGMRAAWEGVYPEDAEAALRIEAAAFGGRPVSFRMFSPFVPLEPEATTGADDDAAETIVLAFVFLILTLFLTVIFGGLYVARRNVRSGRGDGRGARRLGFVMALAWGAMWLLGEHTYSIDDFNAFLNMLVFAAAAGGLTWALYLAVEPFMRRQSPEGLIGWTRLIDGRFHDPLVGRDMLLGCAAGTVGQMLAVLPAVLPGSGAGDPGALTATFPDKDLSALVSSILSNATGGLILALGVSFLYGLTYVAAGRRRWLAYAVWLGFLTAIGFIPGISLNGAAPSASWATAMVWVLGWALWMFVLLRLGILVFIVMSTTGSLLMGAIPTLDLSAWYASTMITAFAILFGVAAYSFYLCVKWKGGIADALVGD